MTFPINLKTNLIHAYGFTVGKHVVGYYIRTMDLMDIVLSKRNMVLEGDTFCVCICKDSIAIICIVITLAEILVVVLCYSSRPLHCTPTIQVFALLNLLT